MPSSSAQELSPLRGSSNDAENPKKENAESNADASQDASIEDFLKLGKYTLYVCVMAELMILSQLSNMIYMVYAGAAPEITACGSTEIDPLLDRKGACAELKHLQSLNASCEPTFKYQFTSVNVEFNYICEQTKEVKDSISFQMLGVMIGSMVFGQLSDSFGRKIPMIICLIGCAVMGVISSLMNNLLTFTICRSFIGFFTGGQFSIMLVFMVENLPKRDRLWINNVITMSPNIVIFAVIAWISKDWRTLAQATAILIVPAILLCCFVCESPRWLARKGKIEEARRALKRISRFNGTEASDDMLDAALAKEKKSGTPRGDTQNYYFYHLFYTWRLGMYAFIIAFSFAVASIVNYGLFFNMEKLSGSMYVNNIILGSFRYAVNILVGIADLKFKWLGRKVIHTGALLVIAVAIATVFLINFMGMGFELRMITRVAVLSVIATTSQLFIVNGITCNELFPTPIRNVAYSFVQVFNRVGVVIAPQIFFLADLWSPLPYLTMLVIVVIDLLDFQCFISETKGQPLKDQMPGPEERIFARRKRQAN